MPVSPGWVSLTHVKFRDVPQRWGGSWFWPWQLDLRSLALFRILLAVAVLMHVAMACVDLGWLYTDAGFITREAVRATNGSQVLPVYGWGFFFWNGSFAWAAFGMVLTALFAVGLLLGYRSRLMAALLFFMTLSLHMRMPLITNAGETLLRFALLWATLLPIGARFSLDRGLGPAFAEAVERSDPPSDDGGPARPPSPPPHRAALWGGVAGLALVTQIGYTYLFAGLFKSGPTWWNGTAVRDVLSQEMYSRQPFADLLLAVPDVLMRPLSFGLLWVELLGMAFLFVPLPRVRLVTVLALMGLHLGFTVFMTVGLFPMYCIAWLSALLPPLVWGRHRAGRDLTVFFDGTCGLCRRVALALMGLSGLEEARLRPAQFDGEARANLPRSWTVREAGGRSFTRGAAVLRVLRGGPLAPLAWALWPLRRALDVPYDAFARRRARFWPLVRRVHGEALFPSRVAASVALVLGLLVSWINIAQGLNRMSTDTIFALQRVGLFQRWTVFPATDLYTAHFMVVATLRDGGRVDLFRRYVAGLGDEVVEGREPNLPVTYGGRWWNWRDELFRNYVTRIETQNADVKPAVAGFAKLLCRRWNGEQQGDARFTRVSDDLSLVFVEYPDADPVTVTQKVVWSGHCTD